MPGFFELLLILAFVLVPLAGIGAVLLIVWWVLRKGRGQGTSGRSSDAARQTADAAILND